MNNKNNIPLYLGIAVAIGILIGSFLNFKTKTTTFFGVSSEETKIKNLINYIQYDYVDEIDTDELLDGAINQIVGKLDPHSVYFTKEELKRDNEQMQGEFVGIGVEFIVSKDTIVVRRLLDNGPSEKVGIKAGDRILTVDKDTLFGINIKNIEVVQNLKGDQNTTIDIGIYRPSTSEILNIALERGAVPIKSVPSYYILQDDLGYIKIDRFARTTYDEFKSALDALISKGMQKLILDLRGNPGGYMNIANKIADEFLEKDKLIVFTKNKKGKVDKDFATSKGDFENGKIYILIDENSASASEIIAGALQDNDKGTIIGRRSFGKGLVQQTMGLGDGSAVRLTISRYYTPTGRSIQKPYDLSKGKEYYANFHKRITNGELIHADSIKVNDSLKFITPKGKIVYGGGGIIPDIFVAIDTTQFIPNAYIQNVNRFTFNYIDTHRKQLKNWNFDTFTTDFDSKIVDTYIDSISLEHPISKHHKNILENYLKIKFASDLFGENAFYQMIHQNDKMIDKVLELENIN